MRLRFCASLILFSVASASQAQSTTASDSIAPPTLSGKNFLMLPGEQWKLMWHDEFDEPKLDAGKWSIGLSWRGDDGTGRHHNSQYASYITDDNISLHDGLLDLQTHRADTRIPSGRVYHYTQALIQTSGKFQYTFGYCEVRVKVPIESGPGLWPAFWMLTPGWPPEDDVAEFWTGRPQPHTHQGFAYRDSDGSVQWSSNHRDSVQSGWHTFGMEWGPGYQIFNRDGVATVGAYGRKVPDSPMYLILNSGVASNPAPTDATVFPNSFLVDYVRVFSRPEAITFLNRGFESGYLDPWVGTNDARVIDGHAHGGTKCLRLTGASASAEQMIFGLKPNTKYHLSGWADADGNGEARIGVKDFGSAEKFTAATARGYQQLQLDFTTGPQATTAIVYCFKPSRDGSAYFDDVQVGE